MFLHSSNCFNNTLLQYFQFPQNCFKKLEVTFFQNCWHAQSLFATTKVIIVCVSLSLFLSLSLSIYLSLSLTPSLFVFLFFYLSVFLFIFFFVCLSLSLCHFLSISLSQHLSQYLSFSKYFSVCLSIYVSLFLLLSFSIYLSVSVCISLCLSLCTHLHSLLKRQFVWEELHSIFKLILLVSISFHYGSQSKAREQKFQSPLWFLGDLKSWKARLLHRHL
jgi:hypothetical protein